MKASKLLYSQCFEKYRLSSEQLNELHDVLFDMMLDVKYICEKYHIPYQLASGTLLGALRHKDFIPWDDDVDIFFFRGDYVKFSKYIKKEFPEKYLLVDPLSDPKYIGKNPQLYLKKSEFAEISRAGINKFNMVYIDFFLFENVPASKLMRKVRGAVYDFCYLASSVCVDYKYPSPVIIKACRYSKELRQYYFLRRRLGHIFSGIGGMRFYLRMCELLGNYKKNTGWIGVPSGIRYNREIFKKEVFENLIDVNFRNTTFKISSRYDEYLTNLYGDNYMELPPVEKREVHAACKFKIPKN